jgi:dipeptidyl aminopeptidase/acylaminoacyl peptidase
MKVSSLYLSWLQAHEPSLPQLDGLSRAALAAVSPVSHISRESPPTLLVHGDEDAVRGSV